jgi:hypothetical protein
MKILLLCVLAIIVFLVVAQAMGWKNFGNAPPVVANKIALLQGVPSPPLQRRTIMAPNAAYGVGQKPCRDFLAAAQAGLPVESYLDWLDGFLAAHTAENPLPAHLVTRDKLLPALTAFCTEQPERTLAATAMALAEELARQPLR